MDGDKTEHVARILGLGFDNEDGHVRITRGQNFEVYLGSDASHDEMSALCLRIQQELERRGQKMENLTREEFTALISDLS